jgi:DNA-binding GntR family transcriptional regulator
VISPLPGRQTLTVDVYEAVKALIMDHVVAPGSRLGIDRLARDLNVSPTPIREALARLESDGLAVKEPLRGYSTTPVLSAAEVEALFEFRRVIEPWAAAHAAQRSTPDGLARLQAELASIAEVPNGEDYEAYRELANHDARFHLLIAELAGNQFLAASFERTHCHLHLFRLRYTTGLGATAIAGHREIVTAVATGDAAAARAAMIAHLKASRSRLLGGGADDSPAYAVGR